MRMSLVAFARRLSRSITRLTVTRRRLPFSRHMTAEAAVTLLFAGQPAARAGRPGYDYAAGYRTARSMIDGRRLIDPTAALRQAFPLARSEFHWGAIDAMADAVAAMPGAVIVASAERAARSLRSAVSGQCRRQR